MISKQEVIEAIILQGIDPDSLSLQHQKALIVSIRMKAIYDPLPEAVKKAYMELVKNSQLSLFSSLKK